MKRKLFYLLVVLLTLAWSFPGVLPNSSLPSVLAAPGVGDITTVAGTGVPGYNGDGGVATSAQLNSPYGVAVDAWGNLFIADSENQRVRKVTASRVITTVAGTGVAGYNGDGGAATSAQLNYPYGVAVDPSGNLFIADFNNQRIRKVAASGVITTVAGTGVAGYNGDGGVATSAQLNYPFSVVVDSSGNLFIDDYGNQRIRKVATSGIITTVAGTGVAGYNGDGGVATSAQLNDPWGVTVDSSGNLFIADYGNQRIRKVATSGIITTVAGTGVAGYNGDGADATSAQLNNPDGVAVDASGNLFIADSTNQRIRKVDISGGITTVAGTGVEGYNGDNIAATSAHLRAPRGVAVDTSGNLFIGDAGNARIRKVEGVAAEAPLMKSFSIDKMVIDFSRQDDRDSINMKAQFTLPDGISFDPTIDIVKFNIDGVIIDIPAGSFKGNKKESRFTYDSAKGVEPKVSVNLDFKKGEVTLVVKKANVDVINNSDGVTVTFSIGSVVGNQTINMYIDALTYPKQR